MTHIGDLTRRAMANAATKNPDAARLDAEAERTRIEAWADRRRQLQRASLIPERFARVRFGDLIRDDKNYFAVNAAQRVQTSRFERSLALWGGDVGTGKTSIAAATCNEAIQAGIGARMLTVVTLLDRMREAQKFSSSDDVTDIVSEFAASPVLLLDDLGKEPMTQQGLSWLHELLDQRWTAKRPLLLTTNFSFDELGERYGAACVRVGEPPSKADGIVDRLRGLIPLEAWFHITGPSRRGES